jgi:hypothetical protein
MNLTQTDLDRFGVAANPKHNTTLAKARAIVEWARKCGVELGELSINFSNAVGGPWAMPIVAVADIRGAVIDPAKPYCFVAHRYDEGSTNLAYAAMLLDFYGPVDVLNRLAAEAGDGFDPMESEYLAGVVNEAIIAAAPKE